MIQINWLHSLMAAIIIFIIGVCVGWFYPRPIKIEYRTSPPQVIEKTVKVYIHDANGTVIESGSASFDPQVFPFENVYKFDNSTVTTNASVTVGMIDNHISVGMVEAVKKEGQELNIPQWGIGGSIDFGFNPGLVGLHYDRVWGFSVTEGVQVDKTGGRGMFVINF